VENWDISDKNDKKTLWLANGMMMLMMLITNPIHPSSSSAAHHPESVELGQVKPSKKSRTPPSFSL
jgi:hypothetical protein